MNQSCVIEARINEYAKRGRRWVPYTVDEIVREAVKVQEAGATVLHYHARKADGSADHSIETAAELVRRLRENTDLYLHTTLGFNTNDDTPETRIENIRILCEELDCGPDIVPIDIGSCNLDEADWENRTFSNCDVYFNETPTILKMADAFSKLDVNVQFYSWGVTFVRRAAALMKMGLIKKAPHFVFYLTGGDLLTTNPPTRLGLESMLEVLPEGAPWGISVGGVSMFDTILPYALSRGGNVSVGLGDYDYPEFAETDNADLVRRVVREIECSGRKPATLEETKQILGLHQ